MEWLYASLNVPIFTFFNFPSNRKMNKLFSYFIKNFKTKNTCDHDLPFELMDSYIYVDTMA